MNRNCLASLVLAALALIFAAECGPAARRSALPLRIQSNQDTVQAGPELLPAESVVFDKRNRKEARLIGHSPPEDHDYFHESREFVCGLRGLDEPGVSRDRRMIHAVFLQHIPRMTDHRAYDDYRFDWPDMGQAFTLGIASGLSWPLSLIPGETYDLIVEFQPGWPCAYGLIIQQMGELVFQGLTHGRVDGVVSSDSRSPVKVSQTRLLEERYLKSDWSCYGKITNVEVTFSLAGDRVVLHQGQSGRLGQYEVNLLVARSVEYSGRCLDAGINGFSFTVSRDARGQRPPSPQPLGDWLTIFLKPGAIEFPHTSDGYPSHRMVPADSVQFPRASALGEILRSFGWSACEKTVSALREGDSVFIPPSRRGKEDEALWTRHYSEQLSRAYTFYVRPDSTRARLWRSDVRERLLESAYVDSVEFSPPP